MWRSILVGLAGLFMLPLPAMAGWETHQGEGFAMARYDAGRYAVTLSCSRGSPLMLTVADTSGAGDELRGVRGVMLWLTMPDGRTDRWPVDVEEDGPAVAGRAVVSDFNLDFFRNGQSFRLDSPLTRTVFAEGDMAGTGAARLAFLERCGI